MEDSNRSSCETTMRSAACPRVCGPLPQFKATHFRRIGEPLNVCPECDTTSTCRRKNAIKQLLRRGELSEEWFTDLFPRPTRFMTVCLTIAPQADQAQPAWRRGRRGYVTSAPAVVCCVTDFRLHGMQHGSVVGEKLTLAVEEAIRSSSRHLRQRLRGGARMPERHLSLSRWQGFPPPRRYDKRRLYLSILTNPTDGRCGGRSRCRDITLAEPGALIGFAGNAPSGNTAASSSGGFPDHECSSSARFVYRIVHRKTSNGVGENY